jgi:hypothetical protein
MSELKHRMFNLSAPGTAALFPTFISNHLYTVPVVYTTVLALPVPSIAVPLILLHPPVHGIRSLAHR